MKLSFEDEVELEGFINTWTPDPSVGDLVRWSLGRIAVKRLRQLQATARDGQHLTLMHALPGDGHVQHIVDWLTADFLAGADWIDRVDDKGRPLKLMKCGSVEQLLHEADKAMKRRLQGRAGELKEGDESLVAELAHGYTVVRLLTPAALDVASDRMRHCVGQGAYDWYVQKVVIGILSLRDPAGHPHVTMEVSDDGAQMSVRDVDGNLYNADEIPAGAVFDGLSGVSAGSLPERLTVRGDLRMRYMADEETVPNDLQVGGRIICDSDPERFPAHLRDKVQNPWHAFVREAFADFTEAAGRFMRGLGEVWRVGDEIDFPVGRRQLYIDPRREAEPIRLAEGHRRLLGQGLPRLPKPEEDQRGYEQQWRNPHGSRPRRATAAARPDFAAFMSQSEAMWPLEPEPAVKVLILPEQEASAPQPGFVPPPAGYYPARRRHAVTVQQVPRSELLDTLMARIAAGCRPDT